MKFEQDLVRKPGAPLHLPTREDCTVARREIRMVTDVLLVDGLRLNTLPPLVEGCCATMIVLAKALNRQELEPEVPHFIEAAVALIEDARTIFDAGMRVDDLDKALVGAVMIELTVRGICAALSVPYEDAMRAANAGLPLPVKSLSGDAQDEQARSNAGGAVEDPRGPGHAANDPG